MPRRLLIFGVFLTLAAATVRILRDQGFIALPPNVAPIAALALFGGTYLPRRLAFAVPLGAMLISDVVIGFYNPAILVSVYSSFMVTGLIGLWIRKHKRVSTTLVGALAGSTVFFLVTNAAVWLFGTIYPHTPAGLMASYVAGLPFFRYTVLGDLAFTGLLFGAFELVSLLVRRRNAVPQEP